MCKLHTKMYRGFLRKKSPKKSIFSSLPEYPLKMIEKILIFFILLITDFLNVKNEIHYTTTKNLSFLRFVLTLSRFASLWTRWSAFTVKYARAKSTRGLRAVCHGDSTGRERLVLVSCQRDLGLDLVSRWQK